MGAKFSSKNKKTQNIQSKFDNIKSTYILKKIFNNLNEDRKLIILKYNKTTRKRLNITKIDLKKLSEIEIELRPSKDKSGTFINITEENKPYFHIYFDDNKQEVKTNFLIEKHNINNIKIIIDYPVSSLKKLFENCKILYYVNFKKFHRNNIKDMSFMFSQCSFIDEINLSNCNTKNVTNMRAMFFYCTWLKEINLTNFKTNNVTDMRYLFCNCKSISELNLKSFDTKNVKDMAGMFNECNSLYNLNISNFMHIIK